MNRFEEIVLKGLRKAYQKLFHPQKKLPPCETDTDKASDMIFQLLSKDEPCMIARFGAYELLCIVNYLGVNNKKHSVWKYIIGQQPQWWWSRNLMRHIQNNAGFFPATEEKISQFCEMMLNDANDLDILGSWLREEHFVIGGNTYIRKIRRICLEPYWASNPWSMALKGKHILVVHPFSDDICSQYYGHRSDLFDNKNVLPEFASLRVIKAIQSIGGETNGFNDWFEALEWMKNEMDKEPYDIVLIGCGAYGLPLAAHAKRTGHKAVHLGGTLQLLFGVIGNRWENPNYNNEYDYLKLKNVYWKHPNKNCMPKNACLVEDACYW